MGLVQKIAVVLVVVVGSVFGWRAVRSALASDEEKIRQVFEDMERGFNGTRMAPVLGGFERGYQDESSGITRDELREVLAYLFLREHDPETKRFRLRMEIDAEALAIELVEPGPSGASGRARVAGGARFYEREDGVEALFWDASFRAELEDRGEGWHVVRTREVNVADIRDLD